jgi:hypothetical protein
LEDSTHSIGNIFDPIREKIVELDLIMVKVFESMMERDLEEEYGMDNIGYGIEDMHMMYMHH